MSQGFRDQAFVWLLIVAGFAVGPLLGLALVVYIVQGGTGGAAQWDPPMRFLAAGLGMVVAVGGAVLLALVARQNVIGRPKALISPSGLILGGRTIGWNEIKGAAGGRRCGVPFVAIAVGRDIAARLPTLDCMGTIGAGPNHRVILVSEQQLGLSVSAAIDRINDIASTDSRPRSFFGEL